MTWMVRQSDPASEEVCGVLAVFGEGDSSQRYSRVVTKGVGIQEDGQFILPRRRMRTE